MAVDVHANARAVGEAFARVVRERPEVRRLWVSPDGETVHLWLEVRPIERDEELVLYGLVDVLYEQFDGVDPFLHIMNPRDHTVAIQDAVPVYAEEVPLGPA